jgi:hypothetical protein
LSKYKINIPNTASSTITDPVLKSLYYQVLQKPKQLLNEIDILGKTNEEIENNPRNLFLRIRKTVKW